MKLLTVIPRFLACLANHNFSFSLTRSPIRWSLTTLLSLSRNLGTVAFLSAYDLESLVTERE